MEVRRITVICSVNPDRRTFVTYVAVMIATGLGFRISVDEIPILVPENFPDVIINDLPY